MADRKPLCVFTSEIRKSPAKGGWTYLTWSDSVAFFGTAGLVKVTGTMDGEPVETAFMAMGDGSHKLPITAKLLRKLGKFEGDTVAWKYPIAAPYGRASAVQRRAAAHRHIFEQTALHHD